MPGPTTNGWSATIKAGDGTTATLLAKWDDPPRELAVLAASEKAGKAEAVKVDKNDGTLTDEVETGLVLRWRERPQ